jgi:hypothetical protein
MQVRNAEGAPYLQDLSNSREAVGGSFQTYNIASKQFYNTAELLGGRVTLSAAARFRPAPGAAARIDVDIESAALQIKCTPPTRVCSIMLRGQEDFTLTPRVSTGVYRAFHSPSRSLVAGSSFCTWTRTCKSPAATRAASSSSSAHASSRAFVPSRLRGHSTSRPCWSDAASGRPYWARMRQSQCRAAD